MCGFAGFYGAPSSFSEFIPSFLENMGDAIRHRGPDDQGIWQDKSLSAGLVHRRLSVLDLSPNGHQPMQSPSRRYVIAYNGEIYNHKLLRSELSLHGIAFRGHSDTEVLLAAFDVWGFKQTLKRCNGMFALALWDADTKKFYLARDRLGEKPLYFSRMGETILFSSELKALHAWPGFTGRVDPNALNLFLRLGYVPGELSIFQDTKKVPPGAYVILDGASVSEPIRYWDTQETINQSSSNIFVGDEKDALNELDLLLRDAVKIRMEADVPLGVFLSGGVDSTLVASLMQTQSDLQVNSFTIGFHESNLNEAEKAKAVAGHLGTNHSELYLNPSDLLDVVPMLADLYDEPFADESQIPTYLISRMARKHVTVALSGDGGDEIFGGYNRYIYGRSLWRKISLLPHSIRTPLAKLSERGGSSINRYLLSVVNAILKINLTTEQFEKAMQVIGARDDSDVYCRLISKWLESPLSKDVSSKLSLSKGECGNFLTGCGLTDISEMMMAVDLVSYLPDDILVKLDRASMGASLEGRIPLLDYRVVEFGWRLPLEMKIRGGDGKWLLRQLLYRYVPQELVDRPKMGFSVPLADWLRGPLKDWAQDLLSERKLKCHGLLDVLNVRRTWQEHLSAKWDHSHKLWNILMFQAWYERWMIKT